MARKRMFDNDIINQDNFLELPSEAKALYFLLGMEADDEGFITPKRVLRMHNINNDNLRILIAKGYLIPFESGVVVITDWKRNNYLDKNKTKPTVYIDEIKMLDFDNEKQRYVLKTDLSVVKLQLTKSLTKVNKKFTQYRVEENSIEENSIEKNNIPASEEKSSPASAKANKHKYGEYKNVLLKDEELQKLKKDYSNWEELIKYLDEYIEMKGYKAKSHYLCIKKWVVNAVKKSNQKNNKNSEKEAFLNG